MVVHLHGSCLYSAWQGLAVPTLQVSRQVAVQGSCVAAAAAAALLCCDGAVVMVLETSGSLAWLCGAVQRAVCPVSSVGHLVWLGSMAEASERVWLECSLFLCSSTAVQQEALVV